MSDLYRDILELARTIARYACDDANVNKSFRVVSVVSQMNTSIVKVIEEWYARGYIDKTRNSRGLRIVVSRDSPLKDACRQYGLQYVINLLVKTAQII